MGLEAIYPKPKTSRPHPQHKIYPYLLQGLTIDRPNQVWAPDITYIPMSRGFMYLVAFMDWHSRKALSWRVSNTMEADFCVEALAEAIGLYGTPEIFNTDQGAQFTSETFTGFLQSHGVAISMKGRCGVSTIYPKSDCGGHSSTTTSTFTLLAAGPNFGTASAIGSIFIIRIAFTNFLTI